ncbi:MAG: MFS transporter [Actinobacteria bacterium]|nr:MFS transporter [Actinomycetota bacterium]
MRLRGRRAGDPASRLRVRDILGMREIRVVVLVTFVIMLGFGILSPVLPLYARSFGVGYGAVGVLVASFGFTRLLFDLFAGTFVDRYGERVMATTGAAVVGLSSALAAVAPNYTLLVVFRGAGGAGSAVFFAALTSYLFRAVPKERMGRVMGVYYGTFNLGLIAGQPLGGVAASVFGLASPLWIYAGACFLSAALYFRSIRDPERAPEPEGGPPRRRGLRALSWNRAFVTVLVVNMAYAWIVAGIFSTLIPLFAREGVGLSERGVGLALAVATATEFFVLFPAGAATDRYGRKAVLLPSLVLLAATGGLLGLATPVLAFFIGLSVLGVVAGYAGVPPSVMLSDVADPATYGTAIGAYRFVADLGFVLGPLIAGAVASGLGFGAAFAVSAVPCVVAAGMLLFVPETRRSAGAGSRG